MSSHSFLVCAHSRDARRCGTGNRAGKRSAEPERATLTCWTAGGAALALPRSE
jgi:hypothetical protein